MSQGGIVWITGIPASGKTTVAGLLANKVVMRGGKAEILDGDEVRKTISKGLGFSREDRRENVRKISWMARRLAKNDIWAVVAAVSPYRQDREEAKKAAVDEGLYFLEVQLKCSILVAQIRDPKGLYKMAKETGLKGVTGLDGPYEESEDAYVIDTTVDSPEEATNMIWDVLLWRPEDNPPTICIGRGYGGTRLVSKLMQDLGIFIGQHEQINECEDSMEWVRLIYRMVEECGSAKEFQRGDNYKDEIRNTARLILKNGYVSPGSPWGWKLPETTLVLPMFAQAFHKAKFIHCVRHPVSGSLRNVHPTADPLFATGKASLAGAYSYCGRAEELIGTDEGWMRNAITWEHQTARVIKYGRALGSDRYFEIKFEDICASPDWALGAMERFLKVRRQRRRPSIEITPARMNKWDVNDLKAKAVWEICGKTAQDLGYTFLEGHDPASLRRKAE